MSAPPGIGAACPAGPPTATFLLFLRPSDAAWSALFRRAERARLVRRADAGFTADSLRGAIARLARCRESDLEAGTGAVRFANGPGADALLTADGDGLALSTLVRTDRIVLSACEVAGGRAVRHLARFEAGPADLVVLPVRLAGERFVVACRTLRPELAADSVALGSAFEARRERFRSSLRAGTVTGPKIDHLGGAPAGAEDCLALRPPRPARALTSP